MSKVFIEESTLTTIGDAIRAKAGTTELIAPQNMGDAITNLPSGGGEVPEIVWTGNCLYAGAYNRWNDMLKYVTTKDITDATNMFLNSGEIETIPFEINFKTSSNCHDITGIFSVCTNLKTIPKINNCKLNALTNMFSNCANLRYLPDDFTDWFDYSYIDALTSTYGGGDQSGMFQRCSSLRSIPMEFLNHGNKSIAYYSSYFGGGSFNECYVLDELVDLPIPYTATWTGNAFSSTFNACGRLKNVTFAMPDGQPYVMNWKNQVINLGYYLGYSISANYPISKNSGITADKRVQDDTEYQALKNDPDWFTTDIAYSRYNHDSAVATINSLPDTSAYLAANGGTNTIKFEGAAGSATDGGAINTLTETEIAVATAKGWTVSLV